MAELRLGWRDSKWEQKERARRVEGWEEGFTLDLDFLAALVELQRQWAGLRCPGSGFGCQSDCGTCELCTPVLVDS